MPRSMPGQGSSSTRSPPSPSATDSAASLTTSALTRGSAVGAEPGLVPALPRGGAVMGVPVRVRLRLSPTGQRAPALARRDRLLAAGVVAAPALPSSRGEDRSNFARMY